MGSEKFCIPKRRFKEFQNTDAWEQRKLREVTDRYDNLRIPVAANLRVPGTTPYYGANGIQDYVSGFTHDGEFVLVAEDGANDLKNYPVKYVKGRIWVNNHAHVLQGKENISDNLFLSYSLNRADIESLLVGGGRAKLNAEIMMGIDILMPILKEQKRIGAYFSNMDNLITLHQRKLEKMKSMKAAYLTEMFPQEGENVPKRRFAGFTDAWEQRKLSEILERRVEQRQQSDEYPRLAFASGQGVIPLSERKSNNREQLTKDEFSKKYLVTELDDIVYNPANVKYGAIDRNKCGSGLISPIYVTFTTNEEAGFIERIVTSHNFQQRALRFEEGTVTKRQSVNPEDFVMLDIFVAPQREEQKKISEYFDNLDNLITLHQRKLDKLQNIKKAYLNEMFI